MRENTKFLQLLTALRNATVEGRIRWKGTIDDSVFRTMVGKGTVEIDQRYSSPDEESPATDTVYVASLLNEDGEIADELEGHTGPAFAVLDELYELARRQARDADALLDSMLEQLSGEKLRKA